MNYTIGAFSKEVELSIDTLRYYEKEMRLTVEFMIVRILLGLIS